MIEGKDIQFFLKKDEPGTLTIRLWPLFKLGRDMKRGEFFSEPSPVEILDLADFLKHDTNLLYLNLSHNTFSAILLKAITSTSSIRDLNLSFCRIDAKGAKAIANMLKVNHSIEILNLNCNSIQSQGAEYIAEALQTNRSLLSLQFDSNYIVNTGGKAIFKALSQHNNTLKHLSLLNQEIDSDCIEDVTELLKNNTCLETLDLALNNFGSNDAIAMAGALKENHSLAKLNLVNNYIEDKGSRAFELLLRHHVDLRYLHLGYYLKIGKIPQFLSRNRKLHQDIVSKTKMFLPLLLHPLRFFQILKNFSRKQ